MDFFRSKTWNWNSIKCSNNFCDDRSLYKFCSTPSSYIYQLVLAICSVLLVGLGGGIYLVANLGPGPRDGLMIGLQKKTNLPIALIRALLEITVVTIGWYLGGVVGVGTLLFAFGIGPVMRLVYI